MSRFLHENHRGSPTLTLLGVLNALNALNVLDMPMDASLACWALFCYHLVSGVVETSQFFLSEKIPKLIYDHPWCNKWIASVLVQNIASLAVAMVHCPPLLTPGQWSMTIFNMWFFILQVTSLDRIWPKVNLFWSDSGEMCIFRVF